MEEAVHNNPTKDYLVGTAIGEGSFGRVVHARHKTSGKDVAIKVVDKASLRKHPSWMAAVWNEQRLLQLPALAASSWVVNLWAAFHDTECVYLVMECLTGGDLQHFIRAGLKEQQLAHHDKDWWSTIVAPYYAHQLARAVEFLHGQQILHGDLKPENVLLTGRGRLQLADFGSAVRIHNNGSTIHSTSSSTKQQSLQQPQTNHSPPTILIGGTVDYASPEVLRGAPVSTLTVGVDLWSLGCVLAALQMGESPFHADSDALAVQSILDYTNGIAIPPGLTPNHPTDELPEGWNLLIRNLLDPDPRQRLGFGTGHGDGQLGKLVPGDDSINSIQQDPPFLPAEPKWAQESKTTPLRDGSRGWSAFLL